MVTLQQLKYFCTLARELHFTRAAEALHITQPTLSYAIVELQKEVGADLFQKEGNKTVLTNYGIAFLPYAEKALAVVEEGKTAVENMLGDYSGGWCKSSRCFEAGCF
jgi:DNA-binding transcriptional LysR family regulator